MSERKQLWFILEAFVVCGIFGALWAVGGSGDFWDGQKWIRRFLGPGLLCLWAFIRSGLNWRYLVQMPVMMAASTLPYGADDTLTKWLMRGLFGAANGLGANVANLWMKRWLISGFSFVLIVGSSIAFGVYNPLPAMAEQFLIGVFISFFVVISISNKPKDYLLP